MTSCRNCGGPKCPEDAAGALDRVEKVISDILALADKNGVTEFAKFKFKDDCNIIRAALTSRADLKAKIEGLRVGEENAGVAISSLARIRGGNAMIDKILALIGEENNP